MTWSPLVPFAPLRLCAGYKSLHHPFAIDFFIQASFGGFMSLWCTRLQSAPRDRRLHESWSLA